MKPIHIVLAILVALCWGGNFSASKFAVLHFPPFMTTFIRYALVALLLLPFTSKPERGWGQLWLLANLTVVMHFGLVFVAIHMGLDVSSTVVAVQLGAPFTCILGAVFLKDRLGAWRITGMAIAFVGAMVVAGTPRVEAHLFAFGLACLGALAWAITNIYMKRMGEVRILPLLAWTGLLSLPQVAVIMWIFEGNPLDYVPTAPWTAWVGIGYSAVFSTIVGYGCWYLLLRTYNVSQVAPFSLLVPVVGLLGGVYFFHEPLTNQMLAGGVLTLIGVAIINMRRPKLAATIDKL
ncbi:MAG: EamA family transporter [Rickettsiales bacterium]|nr:EamA family transporter [Rickettsiales bacterium]